MATRQSPNALMGGSSMGMGSLGSATSPGMSKKRKRGKKGNTKVRPVQGTRSTGAPKLKRTGGKRKKMTQIERAVSQMPSPQIGSSVPPPTPPPGM